MNIKLTYMLIVRGSGGNFAMKDGLDLGDLIANSDGDVIGTLQKYADLAIPRAIDIVLDSRERVMTWTGPKN